MVLDAAKDAIAAGKAAVAAHDAGDAAVTDERALKEEAARAALERERIAVDPKDRAAVLKRFKKITRGGGCLLALLALAGAARAADCQIQDYASDAEPDYACPSPGELALLGGLALPDPRPIDAGAAADADGFLVTTEFLIAVGVQLQAVRRLRWIDNWEARKRFALDLTLARGQADAEVALSDAAEAACERQVDRLAKVQDAAWWERGELWAGLGVGILAGLAAGVGLSIGASR